MARIMARVYVRSITSSTLCEKSSILLAGNGVWNINSVTCRFSSIKIDYSDYPKRFISMLIYIQYEFHEIPSIGYLVMAEKGKTDGQKDGWTTQTHIR